MDTISNKQHRPGLPSQEFLGTAAYGVGAVLVCLGFVAELDGQMPFFMPRSWYVSRSLWYFFAIACFVGGSFLLKTRPTSFGQWQASRSGLRFESVVIYTRDDCELCEAAKQVLSQYPDYLPEVEEIDIATDPELIERFGTCVPVVIIDGKVRFRGRLDEQLLRRLIEGTPPLDV